MHTPSTRGDDPTVAGLLRTLAARLVSAGVGEAALKAEHLLADALDCPRLHLPLHLQVTPDPVCRRRIERAAERLECGEPLQYVLGHTEFMGLRLRVDPRALVPRPETEALVERVLADARLRELEAPRIADIGTGSGCIVLALAAAWENARLFATDLYPAALELARENAARLAPAAAITWMPGDGLSGFDDRSLDAVVSNPPYVSKADWAGLAPEVRDFEPRTALTAGEDGLDVIRALVREAPRVLDRRGRLFVECGEAQTGPVEALMRQSGLVGARTAADLAGRPRIVSGQQPA